MTRLDRYIVGIVATGVVAAVAAWLLGPSGDVDLLVASMLVGAMAVSIWIPIRYQRSRNIEALHVNDGVLLALLFVIPMGVAPVLAGIGSLVGNLIRTRDPRKIAFNVGAHMLAAAGAVAAYTAIGPGGAPLAVRTLVALFGAAAAYNVVDALVYGRLFALLEGTGRTPLLAELHLISAVGSYATGVLLAFMVAADRVASVFAFGFVVAVHLGYRGYARALEERTRNENYHSVTRALTEAVASEDSVERFLAAIRELFTAGSVELLTLSEHMPVRHRYDDDGFQTLAHAAPQGDALREALRRGAPVQLRPHGSDADVAGGEPTRAMAAPLIYHGVTIGALAVHGRRGLETHEGQELQVLASLANDAAIAMQNVQLFRSVEHERSALAEESQKLQDIVDATSDGIAMVDAEGRVVAWNPAMEEVTGTTHDEALGHAWFMALRFRDARGDELAVDEDGPLRAVLDGDRVVDPVDLQVLRRDGEWRWVRCTFSPVSRDGTTVGVVIVARDVTRERETEEMKTDFVATVSHELRTPLTPLKGFLVTLLEAGDRIDPAEHTTFHRSMLRQVERLETLVSDLLVVADLDRGAIRLKSQITELTEVVEAAVGMERPLAEPQRVEIAAATSVRVVGDRVAIQRIVQALISNAVKHTQGRVFVETYRDDRRARVEVHDEGPGVPLSERERVFERFRRLGHHLTRATQGSGLGLSIAKGLAERLDGALSVGDSPHGGAVFTLTVPLAGPRRDADTDHVSATA